jgi:hypothetical protein
VPRYDERFRRMWRYWLLSSAAAFGRGAISSGRSSSLRKDSAAATARSVEACA